MERVSIATKERSRFGSRGRLLLLVLAIAGFALALASRSASAGDEVQQTYYFNTESFPVKNGYTMYASVSRNAESETVNLYLYLQKSATTDLGSTAAASTTQYQTHSYSFSLPASDVVIAPDLKSMSIDTKNHMGDWGSVKLTAKNLPKPDKTRYDCYDYISQSDFVATGRVNLDTKSAKFGRIKKDNPESSMYTYKYRTCPDEPDECSTYTSLAVYGNQTQPDGTNLYLYANAYSYPAGATPPAAVTAALPASVPPPALYKGNYYSLSYYEDAEKTAPATVQHALTSYVGTVSAPPTLKTAKLTGPSGPGVMLFGNANFVADQAASSSPNDCRGVSKSRAGHLVAPTSGAAANARITGRFDIGGVKVFKGAEPSSMTANLYKTRAD